MTHATGGSRSRGPWQILFRRLLHNKIAVTGAVILTLLYFLSCFAGFLSPYHYADADVNSTRYGPMLLGGFHAEKIQTYLMEDEDGNDVEVAEYQRAWRFFDGGVHFHDSEGNFTWRPHIYPLRTFESYDEYGEHVEIVAADLSISLPIRFFMEGNREHEIFSFCGILPIMGRTHLFGVDPLPPEIEDTSLLPPRIYILGSDFSGRDFFTRLLYGGQISLSVGLLGILISMGLGLLVGGVSGYFGGTVDFLLMRLVELLMAIPGLYLILVLRYVFKTENMTSRQTYLMIVVILALAGWASLGRVIRGMVLSLKENEYVLAARALGASHLRIITLHILPNTASFVIVTATLYVPYYILGEAALSFLGLGITEPETSWGLLLKDAQNTAALKYNPWLVLSGVFIFIAVLAYNFLGDGLRDAADPRAVISRAKKE